MTAHPDNTPAQAKPSELEQLDNALAGIGKHVGAKGAALQSIHWRPMTKNPKARQRVLLLTTFGVSTSEWVRTPYSPHKYAYQCECGWFEPERFRAWMPVDELVALYREPAT